MNGRASGAHAVLRTLANCGVEVLFANPGTSEMHTVAALDDVPSLRAVLGLFEGVATGAADGWARMTGRPAATLLHLGPGLANGLANLHNARRAHSPVVNLVGDHALAHKGYDAPLESDIDSMARSVSGWVLRPSTPEDLGGATAEAVAASLGPPGQVATLILPADLAWNPAPGPAKPRPQRPAERVDDAVVAAAAGALGAQQPAALLLGGDALRGEALRDAARVAEATGAVLLAETFPARLERGAGRPPVERLPYLVEFAVARLAGFSRVVLAGTGRPVAFFAYPGQPSDLLDPATDVVELANPRQDVGDALARLADLLAAPMDVTTAASARPDRPTGALTAETLAAAVGALLPPDAVVVDESNTSGLFAPGATAGCPPHDWLTLTGGAIGQGLPLATGVALACPDRRVVCLEADGSAMFTLQALWTQAREGLDVTTIVCNNRAYSVLRMELARVGASSSGRGAALFDLSPPPLDFVALAAGMGVPASRAETADDLLAQLRRSLAEPGPHVIDAFVPALR